MDSIFTLNVAESEDNFLEIEFYFGFNLSFVSWSIILEYEFPQKYIHGMFYIIVDSELIHCPWNMLQVSIHREKGWIKWKVIHREFLVLHIVTACRAYTEISNQMRPLYTTLQHIHCPLRVRDGLQPRPPLYVIYR